MRSHIKTIARTTSLGLILAAAAFTAAPVLADTAVVAVPGAAAVPVTTYHTVVVPVTHRIVHTSFNCGMVATYAWGWVAYRQVCVPVTWFSYFTTYETVTVPVTHTAIVPTVNTATVTTGP